ncbi:MAG: cytochrome b/b6 domain-containing protein [Terricaulis sp.]
MTAAHSTGRKVQVWDLPTRIFHWSLLALVLVAWFTGEAEGAAAMIHRYAGEGIAGLIVFRVIWGFAGGERARFADFAAGPSAIVAHVRDLFLQNPKRHLGHNPLGGLAVFLLLAVVAGVVVTGLFSGGEESSGPFAGLWGLELSETHEVLFRMLQGLVVIHVLGVVVESVKARDALVPAMITGSKRRRADEPGEDARRAGIVALTFALATGVAVSLALMAQQPTADASFDAGDEGRQIEANEEREW